MRRSPIDHDRTSTVQSLLASSEHVDDAVDALVRRYGWDEAFLALAQIEGDPLASEAMFSALCQLLLRTLER